VLSEATELGISATDDPRDSEFEGGKRIAVTTVHRLFNGRSIFGVGAEGVKLRIGSLTTFTPVWRRSMISFEFD
jgi:hypothetical protein